METAGRGHPRHRTTTHARASLESNNVFEKSEITCNKDPHWNILSQL